MEVVVKNPNPTAVLLRRNPDIHCLIGSFVPGTGLGVTEKRKILCLLRIELRTVQTVGWSL
jgi:hypothetical protein